MKKMSLIKSKKFVIYAKKELSAYDDEETMKFTSQRTLSLYRKI